MLRAPKKASLASQTAAILKEQIESGEWKRWLPGEHELCAQMHVSRITLRAALQHLQRQRLVKSSQGKRREILVNRNRRVNVSSDRVILLSPLPIQFTATFWINQLREDLSEAGFHLEFHVGRSFFGSGSAHSLKILADNLKPAGFVLLLSTERMQRWFAERGLPCVIIGSRHQGIELPSVDTAYRASCRHAVGKFLSRGHRRLALLNPNSSAAGDLESEEGFHEAVAQNSRNGVEGIVARHDETVAGICAKIDGLLRRPNAPTGFLISKPGHALTVMSYLLRSGVRIPQDVSLISRDHDSFLEHMLPRVARYVVNPKTMARRISKTVLEMVKGERISAQSCQIIPDFTDGETLGSHPEVNSI